MRGASLIRNDALQMNVAGFDASVPEVVAEFIKGRRSEFTRIT